MPHPGGSSKEEPAKRKRTISSMPSAASSPDLGRAFRLLVGRDLRLAIRQGGDAAMVLAFFLLTIILFPFGVGPEPAVLARIGSGIIWVTALLASLLSLDRLFLADYEDGSLEALALSPLPLALIVLAKTLAHWLVTGLPLALMAPFLALLLGLDAAGYPALILGMVLGTPTLSLIGAIGAALTLGARRGGVLLSLLLLPLFVPVLILGAGAVEAAISGLGARPHLLILAAMAVASLVLAPLAAAAALREALT